MAASKRDFLKLAGAAGVAAAAGLPAATGFPVAISAAEGLSPITSEAKPIGRAEHLARVAKAQGIMRRRGIAALLLEPGASLRYFTGIRWWRSERLTCAVIPADGDIAVVTPYFEEPSVRESMSFGDDVRTWNEHEDPFRRVAGILKDRGLGDHPVAIEETVRYFVVDGLGRVAPGNRLVSGTPVTQGCRMFKSAHEIELMKTASAVTLAAYRHVHPRIETGMRPEDITDMMDAATEALGASPTFSMALIGEASAYPHGSGKPQRVGEGDMVLMDCGCSVHGYQSDMSRSFVHGQPSPRQRQIWDTAKRGQTLGFETMAVGTPAGEVDDAVRRYYESLGFGPGYKTPGLPHRLGHGIGMEGHERINLVHGETTPLAPGMCFSNEPGLYIFGEFGVRLEDCVYITGDGPKWFNPTSPSIDDPMGTA